jgi:hypothetical protein
MSHYEYMLMGNLTPEYEAKVNDLVKLMSEGYPGFYIYKYFDEDVAEGIKKRSVIIHSGMDMTMFFYNHFNDCKLEYRVYFKQRIV